MSTPWDPSQTKVTPLGEATAEGGSGADPNQLLLYQIKGKPAFAYVDLHLQPNQRVVTDANHMLWMDRRIEDPTTECWGGCWDGCMRTCAKEACCLNTYTNPSGQNAKLSVGFNDPGDILSFGVSPGFGWIMTQGAFIAGTDNLDIRGKCPGCCGSCSGAVAAEGFILTHVRIKEDAEKQQGVFVAGSYGQLVRHDVPQGSVLFVSRGLFFAAHEQTKLQLGLAGGIKNCCFNNGAALVLKFYGPAVVYTQSRNPDKWNPNKDVPKDQNKNNGGGAGISAGISLG